MESHQKFFACDLYVLQELHGFKIPWWWYEFAYRSLKDCLVYILTKSTGTKGIFLFVWYCKNNIHKFLFLWCLFSCFMNFKNFYLPLCPFGQKIHWAIKVYFLFMSYFPQISCVFLQMFNFCTSSWLILSYVCLAEGVSWFFLSYFIYQCYVE